MPLGAWLLSMVAPLIGRILLTLGLSIVTVVGTEAVVDSMKATILARLGELPAMALQFFSIAGGGTALGILFGAVTTRLVLDAAKRSTKFIGRNTG